MKVAPTVLGQQMNIYVSNLKRGIPSMKQKTGYELFSLQLVVSRTLLLNMYN